MRRSEFDCGNCRNPEGREGVFDRWRAPTERRVSESQGNFLKRREVSEENAGMVKRRDTSSTNAGRESRSLCACSFRQKICRDGGERSYFVRHAVRRNASHSDSDVPPGEIVRRGWRLDTQHPRRCGEGEEEANAEKPRTGGRE